MSRERIIAKVIEIEGGYSNDPDDPGGETKFGISKRQYPDLDIKNLTVAQATAIYIRDYWTPCNCEKLPGIFQLAVFDSAVNQGVSRACRLFQRTLGVTQDGIIGPYTLNVSFQRLDRHFLYDYLGRRAVHYLGLVIVNPKKRKYFRGWMNRLFQIAVETFRI